MEKGRKEENMKKWDDHDGESTERKKKEREIMIEGVILGLGKKKQTNWH